MGPVHGRRDVGTSSMDGTGDICFCQPYELQTPAGVTSGDLCTGDAHSVVLRGASNVQYHELIYGGRWEERLSE